MVGMVHFHRQRGCPTFPVVGLGGQFAKPPVQLCNRTISFRAFFKPTGNTWRNKRIWRMSRGIAI
jgi:hypothetical protein